MIMSAMNNNSFDTFTITRHICVTLLITHICVQVDYQLFFHQLLTIHICVLYIYK